MSYHPELSLLEAYAKGNVDACHGIALATHLELCAHCRQVVKKFEEQQGEQLAALEQELSTDDWTGMLAEIITTPVPSAPVSASESLPVTIEVNGKSIAIPAALRRLIPADTKWRNFGGKVYSLPLPSEDKVRMSLMYINQAVSVPQHTHKGIESTLVLHGGFRDEEGHYEVGDFIQRDASICHAPQTDAGQDCLCLAILTEPMIFTQGVARVFNLFGKGMYP
ncbi:ChrR family anti-sigma-E factor [Vibrio metschnikovii]|uniref:ChrR family anti-sigma-E factor n=1 Tax=Vibrio metschnikovii TaxID=28172 RepID=UPI002FCB8CC3